MTTTNTTETTEVEEAEKSKSAKSPKATGRKATTGKATSATTAASEAPELPSEVLDELSRACLSYDKADRASVIARQRAIFLATDAGAPARWVAAQAACSPSYVQGLIKARHRVETGWTRPSQTAKAAATTQAKREAVEAYVATLGIPKAKAAAVVEAILHGIPKAEPVEAEPVEAQQVKPGEDTASSVVLVDGVKVAETRHVEAEA
ncbi:hypothetical protein ACFOYW_08355 [Gryllotalpicola reticulitermitis]|uniref:Uncharacterized protein n=1 Tax=Gryllotalpicola reticulitermitis TaxID=1184153 RepID=A0ABV8Q7R0_9MICO